MPRYTTGNANQRGYNRNQDFSREDEPEGGARYNDEFFGRGRKYNRRDANLENYGPRRTYSGQEDNDFADWGKGDRWGSDPGVFRRRPMRPGRLAGTDANLETFGRRSGYQGREGYEDEGSSIYTDTWSASGPYSGIGPRGYQRPDRRIYEDICDRLSYHGQIDASDIEVDVQQGEVTLKGTVEDRRAKRMAEDIADTVSGIRDIHNELRVRNTAKGFVNKE